MYEWKLPGLYKADADTVGKEIESIGKDVTPQQIVDKARDKNTELHKLFEWDDSIAAIKHRYAQAQGIMRQLVVKVVTTVEEKKEPIVVRAYVSSNHNDGVYKHFCTVIHTDAHDALIKQAYKDAEAFLKKYRDLAECKELNASIAEFCGMAM